MKARYMVLCAVLGAHSAFAEDAPKTDISKEIGLEQKLTRVYDLYRRGDAVSLKSSETQLGIGLSYSTSENNTLGLRQNMRAFSTQAFASRGIGHGMELSVAVPFTVQSQRAETTDSVLGSKTFSGFGDPTLRLLGTLPTKDFTTTALFAATLPFGADGLSRRETHTSLGINVNKVLRPAFVSGGLSWEQDWKSGVSGVGYNLGFGFFLNHALSLGGGINGIMALNPKMGAPRDLASFGLKVAYQTTPDFGVVASTNFGLTADTPQVAIGATAYWRF